MERTKGRERVVEELEKHGREDEEVSGDEYTYEGSRCLEVGLTVANNGTEGREEREEEDRNEVEVERPVSAAVGDEK